MDTSEKYILMCEKAEEVQKEWEPEAGDWTNRGIFTGCCSMLTHSSVATMEDLGYEIVDFKIVKHYYRKNDLFWLPRQDQLQEMVKYDNPIPEGILDALSSATRQHMDSPMEDAFCQFNSMEQLWLAFVMHEKYQKQWDEERGEWVKAI